MTLYFSEKQISDALFSELKKNFPRGEISANRLFIRRANTIDYNLLIKHFDCAITKTKNMYNAAITLPMEMEYRVPSWIVQGENNLWINPKPDLNGLNTENNELFITEFQFHVNEKALHKIPETKDVWVQEALLEEFIEVKHALIMGNEEPIDIFRKVYAGGQTNTLKSKAARYLDAILKPEE